MKLLWKRGRKQHDLWCPHCRPCEISLRTDGPQWRWRWGRVVRLKGRSKINVWARDGEKRGRQERWSLDHHCCPCTCVSLGVIINHLSIQATPPGAHLSCPSTYLVSLGTLSNLPSATIAFERGNTIVVSIPTTWTKPNANFASGTF